MAQPAIEKAPLDWNELEGLELDTRANDERQKQFDIYTTSPMSAATGTFDWGDEKSMLARKDIQDVRPLGVLPSVHETRSPASPSERPCSGSDGIEAVIPPTRSKVQRICGLRRKKFLLMYGTILGILVFAAVIGGVIGATRKKPPATGQTPSSTSSPISQPLSSDLSDANSSVNANLPPSDVMVGSPIIPIAFSSTNISEQSYRLYYQAAHGNITQLQYNEKHGGWAPVQTIFTDAMNNTGLAAFTYLNRTTFRQQTSIFYVEENGFFAEKRNFDGEIFDLGQKTFNALSVAAIGLIPPLAGTSESPNPANNWDSYRMAATYSTHFYDGPQGRFFIHQSNGTNSSYVQEWIWNQNADNWTLGQQLHEPLPGSHLAATVDEVSNTLRLFYATADLTLQEKTLDISQPNAMYEQGITIPKLLTSPDSDIAAISTLNATLLYCYTNSAIYEVNITGQQVSSPLAPMFVSSPNITVAVNGTLSSLYQPLGAVFGTSDQKVNIFWAEQVVAATSGYGALITKNKDLRADWNTSISQTLSIGAD